MPSDLDVYLSGVLAGHVRHVEKGSYRVPVFSYTEQWLDTPGSYPLSLSMPLTQRTYNTKRTSRYLESLLPENPQTLWDWSKRYRAMNINDPASVLSIMGEDVAGAAKFVPAGAVPDLARSSEHLTDTDVGEMLADIRTHHGAMLNTDSPPKVSLAGQQPKIGLYRDEHGWQLPHGDLPSTHILKPAAEELTAVDINEAAMLRAAAAVGIPTSRSTVEIIGGQQVFITQRYDRMRDGAGQVQRIHQEDFAQAMGYARTAKYQRKRGPSLKEIIPFLREHVTDSEADLDMFNRLLAFNVAIGNADAHAKNHSLIIAPTGNHLAPAYDLMSVSPYPAYDQELAFSIGRQYRSDAVSPSDWTFYAGQTGQDPDHVLEAVADTWDKVPDAVADALQDYGAPAQMRDMILASVASAASRVPELGDRPDR